jgi:Glycosyl transferase family 11
MLIIKLTGGLGNQLFQYAAAKALSTHLHTDFLLDDSFYKKKKNYRTPELYNFNVKEKLATTKQINFFVKNNWLYNRKKYWLRHFTKNIYQEKFHYFDKDFFKLKSPVLLDGYFQSELYFKNIEFEIRNCFQINPVLVENVALLANEIKHQNAVSVHIRRSDYLLPQFAKVHGVLPSSYYQKAIEQIKASQPNAVFYVFSDDIDWAKQNLTFNQSKVIFATEQTKTAMEDFYLMTQCTHNIIANSSFSWWAAWLNSNPKKMVIAPHIWFVDKSLETKDVIPQNWIIL